MMLAVDDASGWDRSRLSLGAALWMLSGTLGAVSPTECQRGSDVRGGEQVAAKIKAFSDCEQIPAQGFQAMGSWTLLSALFLCSLLF